MVVLVLVLLAVTLVLVVVIDSYSHLTVDAVILP